MSKEEGGAGGGGRSRRRREEQEEEGGAGGGGRSTAELQTKPLLRKLFNNCLTVFSSHIVYTCTPKSVNKSTPPERKAPGSTFGAPN